MDPGELTRETDRLYGLPLDGFVAARNDLAARLRKGGDAEAAARIKALTKPSVAAWVVNQLHRERAAELEALFEAGTDLREAQRDALAGEGAETLRDATAAQRGAISKLTASARALLEAGGHAATDTTQGRVGTTLQALAASGWPDEGAGRLARDLDPPGFDALAGLLAGSAPARPPRPAAPKASEAHEREAVAPAARKDEAAERLRREQRAEAAATLTQAKTRVKAARREAERAEVAQKRADDRAKASRRRAEEAEREASEARARADASEAEATESLAEMERARAEIASAEAEVTAAEEALERF